jgi:hypothetical protein
VVPPFRFEAVQVAVIGKSAVVVAVAERGAVVDASRMYFKICTWENPGSVVVPVPPPVFPPVLRQFVVDAVVPVVVLPTPVGSVGSVGQVGFVGCVTPPPGGVGLVGAVGSVGTVGAVTDTLLVVLCAAARFGIPDATRAIVRMTAGAALPHRSMRLRVRR